MLSSQKNPLVSICIPTYNNARFLRESLDSIVNQTYSNKEIIVSDNASTDETEKIVKEYVEKYKVKYYKNEKNIGAEANFTRCIELATGVFIAIYHSDDIYKPDIIDKEAEFLQKYSHVGAVFALDVQINENGKIIGETNLPKELKTKNIYNFIEIYKSLLKNGNCFLRTPTCMARKFIYNNVGLFNGKEFGTSADLEMWLRISTKYPIGILNEKLMKRRISNHSYTTSYWRMRTKKAHYFLVMDYFLKLPDLMVEIEEKDWKQYQYYKDLDRAYRGRNLLIKGEIDKAKNLLNKSLSRNFIVNSLRKLSRVRQLIIVIILIFGINIGFGKHLGNIIKLMRKRLVYKYRSLI
ncbi:MAG: glycosyltransferase family 2 protein [Actinobacteria bacterium]|nr:glycosyltransferase family 2 protein [Actinomycetota bacterium]